MKKVFTPILLFITLLIANSQSHAQCSFISPTVEISNIATNLNGNCEVTMNLSFDIVTNSGNKIIFIHLWNQANYPSLNYGCNQCQPTAANLINTIANFVIDNSGVNPVFLSSYGPANSVAVKTPVNTPGLTIQKTTSTNVGADKMIISNVKLTIPGACTNSFSFQGDAWSSNSNSNNPVVHCAMQGFIIGGTDPLLTTTRSCLAYTLQVSTISTAKDIYYDVYMDDGDGIFEPTVGQDILVNTVSSGGAIHITPSTPYNSGTIFLAAPYNVAPYTTRKMFVALSSVGQSFIGLTSIAPFPGTCGLAPIILTDFFAYRKTSSVVQLSWKTHTEINAKGFDIERKIDNGYIKVAYVAAKNSQDGASYSFTDNNTAKSISLYRIKMIDQDGSSKLSEVRSVKGNSTASDFTIFPNPSTGNTKISISDIAENTDVQLIDNNGRVIKTIAVTNTNAIEINNLQKGIYLVRIVNKNTGEAVTKKLTVLQ
jgi:Secretion system C-terminal sorting domain